MATVIVDTLIHIFTVPLGRTIGVTSMYADKEHPGTNKKIEGWKWDERYWPTTKEFEAANVAPSIWDPTLSGLQESMFQSGYGDNKDLLMVDVELAISSGYHSWAPKVNHGYFYIYNEEWYLYSDTYQTEYPAKSVAISGYQYLDLKYQYKPAIPIQVRQYAFNSVLGRHTVSKDFRRKVEFTEDSIEPEFRIESATSGTPRLWLNGNYAETVGVPITLDGSGFANPVDTQALELMGISTGEIDQEFYTSVSPVDPYEPIEVWTYFQPSAPRQWDVLSGVETWTSSGHQAVHIDHDKGVVSFGYYDEDSGEGYGLVPKAGERIVLHYTKGVAVHYEPEFGNDYILAKEANINPVASSTHRGFVHVLTKPTDPAFIALEAELPTNSPTYLINLGNNTGRLIATVKDSGGRVLEGEEVTFEILPPEVGTFGAARREISAITNADGEAKVIYNAPTTIEDVGQATATVSYNMGDTVIEVDGITDPGSVSGLYLYKVHYWDPPLGIPSSGLDDYYTNYFDEEDIISGYTATQSWEEDFRTIHELGKPAVYEDEDLKTGKKTAVLTKGFANTVHPHDGDFDTEAWRPMYAAAVEDIGTDEEPRLKLTYTGELDLPGINDTKAYFIVGDARTRVRAYVINRRTNTRLYSNEIAVKVAVPDEVSGTYFADVLNNVPSGLLTKARNVYSIPDASITATSSIEEFEGHTFEDSYNEEKNFGESYIDWFRRTRKGDSYGLFLASLGLQDVDIAAGIGSSQGLIPLGFRLKSSGITVASILDQVTYLDPNDHLPQGYFDLESEEAALKSTKLGMQFEVSIP